MKLHWERVNNAYEQSDLDLPPTVMRPIFRADMGDGWVYVDSDWSDREKGWMPCFSRPICFIAKPLPAIAFHAGEGCQAAVVSVGPSPVPILGPTIINRQTDGSNLY